VMASNYTFPTKTKIYAAFSKYTAIFKLLWNSTRHWHFCSASWQTLLDWLHLNFYMFFQVWLIYRLV